MMPLTIWGTSRHVNTSSYTTPCPHPQFLISILRFPSPPSFPHPHHPSHIPIILPTSPYSVSHLHPPPRFKSPQSFPYPYPRPISRSSITRSFIVPPSLCSFHNPILIPISCHPSSISILPIFIPPSSLSHPLVFPSLYANIVDYM